MLRCRISIERRLVHASLLCGKYLNRIDCGDMRNPCTCGRDKCSIKN